MDEVKVVAHSERATLRVGDMFLKVDASVTHGMRYAYVADPEGNLLELIEVSHERLGLPHPRHGKAPARPAGHRPGDSHGRRGRCTDLPVGLAANCRNHYGYDTTGGGATT